MNLHENKELFIAAIEMADEVHTLCPGIKSRLPSTQMNAKIRHFYDLHYLLQDDGCRAYIQSQDFRNDFQTLLDHDRHSFEKPDGWQHRSLSESPLITDLHATWLLLQPTYLRELPDLAYRDIPSVNEIEDSTRIILQHINV